MRATKINGITLIALVITIIVLLILAGVTIATLTGDNGIIGKARRSKIQNRVISSSRRIRFICNRKNFKR